MEEHINVKEELNMIIINKEIRAVFQPIISLRDGSILGHEALSRITCGSAIENPEMLFNIASKYNRLWDLELLCRTTALEAAYKFMIPPYSKKLFLNVNPNIIHDEKFIKGFTKGFLKQYDIAPQDVIFEITERNVVTDIEGFTKAIGHYKEQDYKIAIDDAGAGYSGLNLISDVNPHYIKLDMKLIRNVNKDGLKFALLKGMVEFSRVSNISLIAEGIETYEELDALVNLGVQYGQGYYIQKPSSKVIEIRKEILRDLNKLNTKKNNLQNNLISNIYIKHLCKYIDVVNPHKKVSDVYEVFKNNPDNYGLCVVKDKVPVGIVTQERLALKLSGHYGFTLNQNKPISDIMDDNFLSVDSKTSISDVSSIAMSRPNNKLYDFIVVTENDEYIGTVTVKDLLQKTTEIEVSTAKHQNPLSGLPGNLLIEQSLIQSLTTNDECCVAYIDIDNFKVYNDCYGFEKGDLVIKLLADILKDSFEEYFVGHIGGDDFIVIFNESVNMNWFKPVITKFESKVLNFYNEVDKKNGYIIGNNRQGIIEKFPLITITVVFVNNKKQKFNNIYELTENLAEMKKNAKKLKCS